MSFVTFIYESITGKKQIGAYGAQPSTFLRPGVNYRIDRKEPNDVIMHASSTLALVCLGDPQFLKTGRWSLTQEERKALLHRMDHLTYERAGDESEETIGDGTLSKEDFINFCADDDHRKWVLEELPSCAHGLACTALMSQAFEHFDSNHDKVLDEKEWDLFMDFVSQLRLRYLQQMALVTFRAYFGRGQGVCHSGQTQSNVTKSDSNCNVKDTVQEVRKSTTTRLKEGSHMENMFQYGVIVKDWKGWRSDLYYYSANVHPLHGIWACCHNNRLARSERFMMELSILCYCFWMAHERHRLIDEHTEYFLGVIVRDIPWWLENDRYFTWLCVTIPGMIIFYIQFFLFTTPYIGTVDESSANHSLIRRANMVTRIGDFLGNALVLGLITGAAIRLVLYNDTFELAETKIIYQTLFGRLSAYFAAWALMVGVYFNPFVALGSTKPGTTSIVDLLGIGQWSMEKSKVELTTLILQDKEVDLRTTINSHGARKSMSNVEELLKGQDEEKETDSQCSIADEDGGLSVAEKAFMERPICKKPQSPISMIIPLGDPDVSVVNGRIIMSV